MKRTLKSMIALALAIMVAAAGHAGEIQERDAVRAIVGEAAGEGADGMLAVACAIRNRGTLRGVYGARNPMTARQPGWVWQQARAAWARSVTNDVTRGATHWENVRVFGRPSWAASMSVTTNIGRHTFYARTAR
jgi:spore germination cell wall hydrolase CwlJ-like protein